MLAIRSLLATPSFSNGFNTSEAHLTSYDQTISAYDKAAVELAERYDSVPGGAAFHAVTSYFPPGGLALDVGAGSGRDARWLESIGFKVVAVEPSRRFRELGSRRPSELIRWIDDRLPSLDSVYRLGVAFDLIILSAVWQHVDPRDRGRALRKLATLLRSGGVLALNLRSGPAPADRPMFPTSLGEVEALARIHGMEILKVQESSDLQNREGVQWTTVALRIPDDGTGALPLVRGIVLGDEKSSTYKLALLRAVARVAEHVPAAALTTASDEDTVNLPLGLVALFWIRMYLPLVRLGFPQAPKNRGPDGLGFAKSGFRRLLADRVDPSDLRVGAMLGPNFTSALASAIGEAASTIAKMPATFMRFPNSDRRVFQVVASPGRKAGTALGVSLQHLQTWGTLVVPGHLWRALSRYGAWIEPMLVSEWGRLSRGYAVRMGLVLPPGSVEAGLEWREPERTTAIARSAAERLMSTGEPVHCVWSGKRLSLAKLDIDHCFPWAAWPCGDLWNLAPSDPLLNRHEKRGRLPSSATLADSKTRMIDWWEKAYFTNAALNAQFRREASAALPISEDSESSEIFSALDWRRLKLAQDQRVPEWTRVSEPRSPSPSFGDPLPDIE